jgi:hypothetical protein
MSHTALTPAKQLAGFLDKFDPAIAKLARSCRTELRKQLPTAIELVYDNYQALAIGFASTEKAGDCIVSLAVLPKNIALSFYYGVAVPDPQKILQGDGKQNRYIRLESAAVLRQPDVKSLIQSAVSIGKTALSQSAKGYTVIKSISAKQRPRRPTTK